MSEGNEVGKTSAQYAHTSPSLRRITPGQVSLDLVEASLWRLLATHRRAPHTPDVVEHLRLVRAYAEGYHRRLLASERGSRGGREPERPVEVAESPARGVEGPNQVDIPETALAAVSEAVRQVYGDARAEAVSPWSRLGGRFEAGQTTKACRGCAAVKHLDDFYKDLGRRDGRRARCKACENATRRAKR